MLATVAVFAALTPFSTQIDNPYFPLRPGDVRVYRVSDPDGTRQRAVMAVTERTKRVASGVRTRVVTTVVTERGRVVERNDAWFAQDAAGSVWYLGERAREISRGRVTSTEGSWEAGRRGAQGGVMMPASPQPGLAYEQERAPRVAEDRAEVVRLGERVQVPAGRYRNALLTKEGSGLQPAALDYKLYARGVGLVLGLEVSGGAEREELVRFRRGR